MAHLDCSFYSPSLRKNAKLTVFLPTMSADDYLFNDDHPKYFAPDAKLTICIPESAPGRWKMSMLR